MAYIMDLTVTQPYSRVQLFSGGGYRFGYYLGSYAALCAHKRQPDLILGTCGGSLAALLVDIAPDPQQLKQLVESKALYKVVRASQPRQGFNTLINHQSTKPSYFYQAFKRLILSQQSGRLASIQQQETHAELLAELQRYAMFEIANEAYWLDELVQLKQNSSLNTSLTPDIAIVASRLVTEHSKTTSALIKETQIVNSKKSSGQTQINKQQVGAKLQEILFSPAKLLPCLQSGSSLHPPLRCPTYRYAPKRIFKDIHIVDEWDIKQAVRASMADMYYLQPTLVPQLGWCLGGVIDLTPIELASKFGQTVFAETKNPYDKLLAAPAIKRIFGFDPNQRLNAIRSYQGNIPQQNSMHWLPFADNAKALAGQHARKRVNIRAGQIDVLHTNYDAFVQQMQAQWRYGYERTVDYLQLNILNKN